MGTMNGESRGAADMKEAVVERSEESGVGIGSVGNSRDACGRKARLVMRAIGSRVGMAVVALTAVCLLGAGCGRKDGAGADKPQARVGVILPLTGEASSYGVDCRRGVELAAAQAGQGVQFIFEDSKADPKQAVTAIQRLISQHQVTALIGDMFSSTTLAIAPIAQQEGVVLLTPTAADEQIPATGDRIFSIYPSASVEGQFVANAIEEAKISRVAVLYQNQTATKAIADAFAAEVKKRGGTVVLVESISENASDYRSLVEKTLALTPTTVFISAYRDPVANLIVTAKELGANTFFATQSTLYDEKALSDYSGKLDGVLLSGPFFDDKNADQVTQGFVAAYRDRHGSVPSVWAAYGHDAAMIILQAIRSKESNGTLLHNYLANLDFNGLTGQTRIGEGRHIYKQMALFKIENNRFVRIDK